MLSGNPLSDIFDLPRKSFRPFTFFQSGDFPGHNVTFPARLFIVHGDRRNFALLRAIHNPSAQNRVRDLVLRAYRTLKNGDLAIAVYLPDFVDHSSSHVDRWRPFIVASAEWLEDDQDLRSSRWYRRYLEGDWNVENGPAFQIGSEIKLNNGLPGASGRCDLEQCLRQKNSTSGRAAHDVAIA